MTYQELITGCALLVAVISLISTWVFKRGDGTTATIKAAEERWREEHRLLENRVSNLMERNAEISADISQVKLELVQSIVNVPTREQLTEAIDRSLAPVLAHMAKTERALEMIYTSGLLHRRQQDG